MRGRDRKMAQKLAGELAWSMQLGRNNKRPALKQDGRRERTHSRELFSALHIYALTLDTHHRHAHTHTIVK